MTPARIAAGTAAMLGIGIGLLYKYQGYLLYQNNFPPGFKKPSDNPSPHKHPGEMNMKYRDYYFHTSDGKRLHAWFINAVSSDGSESPEKKFPTLLFYHANAGNMGFRLIDIRQMVAFLECNVFIVSYRGYGESEGHPDEEGLQLDAEAAYQEVLQIPEVDPTQLFVYGRSLGGAVALSVAERHGKELKGVILENTFTSISDMVDHVFPILSPLKPWVLRIGWKSIERIGDVTCPLLFMSGQKDELVPREQMQALFDRANSTTHKKMHKVEDGSHNDTLQKGGNEYFVVFRQFMSRALEGGESGESWDENEMSSM